MVQRRKHGYLEALRDNRIPIDRELVVCNKIDYQIALEETTKLLQKPNRPDAILAFNDIVTFAAFTAIKQQGFRIPEDVALIGFTDDAPCRLCHPSAVGYCGPIAPDGCQCVSDSAEAHTG